ncbi:MAG TPA: DUF222 domain-containing protein, partial [Euzebya sp.]|nr:DUF222 domain-containing protein [Euzebya sp.]
YALDGADPIDRVVADLRAADRAMARVLPQVDAASARDGLSVRRQVALLAGATGSDVGFLDRAVQVLAAMPRTQQAFDEGALSWSQIRGIVLEARRLSVTQRAVLDEALAGTVSDGLEGGEPDRVVEVCGDIAALRDVAGQERLERSQERRQRFGIQLDFEGWGIPFGQLGPEVTASLSEALDLLADAPLAPDAPPASDDDGTPLPAVAQPPRTRAAQWAEALGRMAAMVLGGTSVGCPGGPGPGSASSPRGPTCSTATGAGSGR